MCEEKQNYYIVINNGMQEGSPHTSRLAANYHARKSANETVGHEVMVCLMLDSFVVLDSNVKNSEQLSSKC